MIDFSPGYGDVKGVVDSVRGTDSLTGKRIGWFGRALGFLGLSELRAGMKLLNPGIKITTEGLKHALDRHTYSGIARFAKKSKFNSAENVVDLIKSAEQQPMVKQPNGRFARTFDVGRNIGIDRNTGNQTSIMTVIVEPDGTLVTAFPGAP